MSTIPNSEYHAGPMTGIPYFNFPAFDSLAAQRRREGRTVFNPHERDQTKYPTIDTAEATKLGDTAALAEEIGFSFAGALEWDLQRVIDSERIVMLPGWAKSTGARAERFVAECVGNEVWLAVPNNNYNLPTVLWQVTLDPSQKRMTVSVTV